MLCGALIPMPCHAGGLRADIGVYNRYVDLDLLVLTPEPVVQGGVYLDIGKACSLMAWGSHGIATKRGRELDLGGSCSVRAGNVRLTGGLLRSFISGSDVTGLVAGAGSGRFDLTVKHYLWDGHPSGTRAYATWLWLLGPHASLRPTVAFETGFALPDIVAAGFSGEVSATRNLALTALVLAPIHSGPGFVRHGQAMVGVRRRF